MKKRPTEEMVELLKRAGSMNYETAIAAQRELAKALTLPLKQGVLKGDILAGIFEPIEFAPGTSVEFPLDFLSPGSEKDYVAYTIPAQGKIPYRQVEGDYVMVPTYEVASSINWTLKYNRDARWDIVGRAMQVLEASFIRKDNQDGWHTILAAGVNRNLIVYDDAAPQGLFTKRLVALAKTIMRRNAGGNSTSINQGRLTDLYVSPESLEDVRSWDLTQVDDFTRREIFIMDGQEPTGEPSLVRIFGVTLHDIDEFGVGQEFQTYYSNILGGTLPTNKTEIMVGLDLKHDDCFVKPIRQPVELFEDPMLHRERQAGLYGWGEHGFAALDGRRVLLLAA